MMNTEKEKDKSEIRMFQRFTNFKQVHNSHEFALQRISTKNKKIRCLRDSRYFTALI